MNRTVPLIEELASLVDGNWVRTPYFEWKIEHAADHLRLNARFQRCQQLVNQAKSACDWRTYISLHLPQYREMAFFTIQEIEEIPHPLNNQMVGEIWCDPGILHSSSCFVLAAMRRDTPHDPNDLMTDSELRTLRDFPPILTAFRSHLEWNQIGPCWTLEEQVAEQFGIAYSWDVLTTARIPHDCVMAYFGRRGESELIIRNFSAVEIVAERRLKNNGTKP